MVALPGHLLHPSHWYSPGTGWWKCPCTLHLYPVLMESKARYRETLLVIVLGFSVLYLILDRDWMLYTALATGIAGMLSIHLNRWIHIGWYFIGEKMGFVVSKVVLGALYFIVLVPMSLLARIFRKDVMNLKSPPLTGYHERDHLFRAEDLEEMW